MFLEVRTKLAFRICRGALKSNNQDVADKVVEVLHQYYDISDDSRFFFAACLFEDDKTERCEKILDELGSSPKLGWVSEHEIELLKARCLLRNGEQKKAHEILHTIEPISLPDLELAAKLELLESYAIESSQPVLDRIRRVLETLLKPPVRRLRKLAKVLIEHRHHGSAVLVLNSILEVVEMQEYREELLISLTAVRQYEEAISQYTKLKQVMSNNPRALLAAANALQARGRVLDKNEIDLLQGISNIESGYWSLRPSEHDEFLRLQGKQRSEIHAVVKTHKGWQNLTEDGYNELLQSKDDYHIFADERKCIGHKGEKMGEWIETTMTPSPILITTLPRITE